MLAVETAATTAKSPYGDFNCDLGKDVEVHDFSRGLLIAGLILKIPSEH